MKTSTFLICLFILLYPGHSFSQNERDIWYFGNQAGIDFNTGPPVPLLNSAMITYDNCTSICDSAGNLLFYSNGVTVWNKYHLPMSNGEGLLGDTSCTNGALAVTHAGRSNLYFLFTNDAFAGPAGLRYSVIDMNLDGGNGAITSQKNIPLLVPNTEKTLAVYHENHLDIWIIAHAWNSDAFYAYLLTSSGLDTNAVISHVGSYHSGGTLGTYNSMGQISASPDGSKIGLAIYDFQQYELFDFDNYSGVLSNPIVIPGFPNAWGVEFSPDGSKLYTTCWKFSPVYQFDISSNNAIPIINSMIQVGNASSPDPQYDAGFLQLAPDGKIYIAKFNSGYLASIGNPNDPGMLCNFTDDSFYLGGRLSLAGLPTFIKTKQSVGVETINGTLRDIDIYPNPVRHEMHIRFNDQKQSDVTISLFDIQGKFLRSLYNGMIGTNFSPTELTISLEREESLKTGIYLLEIRLNGLRHTEKISLVRD